MPFGNEFQTSQTRQGNALLLEVAEAVGKIGRSLADLDKRTQQRFEQHARDVAAMRDDQSDIARQAAQRFHALAERHARGGPYRGRFCDADTARKMGLFIIASLTRADGARAELERAGVQPTIGVEGGYVMPELLVSEIVRNLEDTGVWERNVDMMPVPVLAGAIPTRTGGLTLFYPDYEQAATPSAPTFGRANFQLKRHCAFCLVERWMLQSELAVALAEFVSNEMSYTLATGEDANWFVGDGTAAYGGYAGLLNDTNTKSHAPGDSKNTFAKVIAETTGPLSRVLGTLPSWAVGDGFRWYMHSSVFFSYMGIKDSAGMPIVQLYLSDTGLRKVLFGYPVEWAQVMPAQGGGGDGSGKPMLLGGDLRRSCRGFRHVAGISMRSSEHVKFAEGQVAMLLDVPQDRVVADPDGVCRLLTD